MLVYSLALLAVGIQHAYAFPSQLSEAMIQIRSANEAKARSQAISECPFAKRQAKGVTPPFDASQQYVSNQGDHAFVAPSGDDQRGPCKFAIAPQHVVLLTF